MSAAERRQWADRVRAQMDRELPAADEIVVLAGQRYRELLLEDLQRRANRVRIPMKGLRLGEQLRWLGEPREAPDGHSRAALPAETAPTADGAAIAARLLELDPRIDRRHFFPALEAEATDFVLADPYAFLLATSLDRGTRAEVIWTIPFWLRRQWGHLDPERIRSLSEAALYEALNALPRRPRYMTAAPKTIAGLTRIVCEKHGGDARAVWKGRTPAALQETLRRIPGVGPGIASMAVQLIERVSPGELLPGGKADLDIKPDVHTRRVLYRLGAAPSTDAAAALAAARALHPDYPGKLDGPLWYIGYRWCHPREPSCSECLMAGVCARTGVEPATPDGGSAAS